MTTRRSNRSWRRTARIIALGGLTLTTLSACSHLANMMGNGVEPPAAEQFGMGPRASTSGAYQARLEVETPLRPRRLQSLRVVVMDAEGHPVDGASIDVSGWMPQHGHGMPTRPRVTGSSGAGVYEVEGVRFNMGGWWELRLAISTPSGEETVTFNLDI